MIDKDLERYHRGELSDEQAEAVELRLLSDPDAVDALEELAAAPITSEFDQEIAELIKRGLEDDPQNVTPFPARPKARSGIQRLMASPQYAAAASLLLMVSLVFSGLMYQQSRDVIPGADSTRLVPLVTARGSTTPNIIPAGSDGEWLVLLVDPGLTEYSTYRATVVLETETGSKEISKLENLKLGYEEMVAVGIPGHLLGPGDYAVQVAGRMDEWPADRFEEVTRVPIRAVAD